MSTLNWSKIREFLLQNEQKIVLLVGFCLISAVSFGFGMFWAQKTASRPLVIEKGQEVPQCPENAQNDNFGVQAGTPQTNKPTSASKSASGQNCAFVGSKNSNKFYLPTCSYAKRVKPENLVCFKNAAEALAQGRTESKCK